VFFFYQRVQNLSDSPLVHFLYREFLDNILKTVEDK